MSRFFFTRRSALVPVALMLLVVVLVSDYGYRLTISSGGPWWQPGFMELLAAPGTESQPIRMTVHGLEQISSETWNVWTEKWSTDLSVKSMRDQLMTYSWIKEARIVRRNRDDILVFIKENSPQALQYEVDQRYIVFVDGRRVRLRPEESDPDYVPRVYGAMDAEDARDIPALLDFLPRELGSLHQIRRVKMRRWDIVSTDGIRIKLPSIGWRARAIDLQTLVTGGLVRLHRHSPVTELDFRVPGIAIVKENTPPGHARPSLDGCTVCQD